MAVAEYPGSKVQLLIKDDRGAADGAREGAQQAIAEGAEIISGRSWHPRCRPSAR